MRIIGVVPETVVTYDLHAFFQDGRSVLLGQNS
jgi:hypothetical protein